MNEYLSEILLDRIEVEKFANEDSAFAIDDLSEEYKKIKEQLMARLMELADKNFTDYQKRIFKLLCLGKTKREIAVILNLKSVAVFYAISGVYVYEKGKKRKIWGGIIPKFRKLCQEDKLVQELLQKIQELRRQTLE